MVKESVLFPRRGHASSYITFPSVSIFTASASSLSFLFNQYIPFHSLWGFMATPNVCRWGTTHNLCNMVLEDVTSAGIARHIKEVHFGDDAHPWHPRNRGNCCWHQADTACHKNMFYGNFGKHIAAVHLRSMTRTCRRCGGTFARSDALARHTAAYCSADQPQTDPL